MPELDLILAIIKNIATQEPVLDNNCTPTGIKLSASDIVAVCKELQQNSSTYFDMLSNLTGVDNGAQSGTMEVIYHLYSIPFNYRITLKVELSRDTPEIDTVSHLWRTANWHEREAYDMFGIIFKGHPDLRRILLPADWDGHPLRKDYKHQEYYRGIRVEY